MALTTTPNPDWENTMTTFNTAAARAVLDWIDGHPDLPELCLVSNRADEHQLQTSGHPTLREFLTWHDMVTDASVEMRHYPEANYVHFYVRGSLTGVGNVLVYGGIRGGDCDLLLANGLVRDDVNSPVDVEVLRRLSDARVAEAVA